ncbi:MAG: hypothetical protein ACAI44_38020 [Candidatus Sericytochromatia bacterium]
MPRIVYIGMFLLVAAIPFLLFSALANLGPGGNAYHSGYYNRGPRFFFLDLDFDGGYRGRGYSSGGFQGGGFHAGK